MAIYLGIDGGGTKTLCAVGDDTRVLATAASGGSNVVRSGEAKARESFMEAMQKACALAQVTKGDIRRVCVGASGAARAEVSEFVRGVVGELADCEVLVVGDTETTMYAAFEDGPGVIVIAGTGSIAYGRNRQGKTLRAGGWGFAVSDEGSGHWIGRTGVSEAFRARDEGRTLSLLEAISERWGVGDFEALVQMVNKTPPPNFSDLFPVVLQMTAAGDELAARVLNRAGRELAEICQIVMGRLFTENETVPVAMSGGVFRESAAVRDVFYNEIRGRAGGVSLNTRVVDAVDGALALARVGSASGV